jgi:glycosyltransferase involved in cell wall biosynthesis
MSWKNMKNDRALTHIPPTIWINTGAWLLRQKKRIYGQSDITVICPSAWLRELAMQSPVFTGKEIMHIYNGVDTDVFTPGDKLLARRKLGLPEEYKTVMFSAQFLGTKNPWKGGSDLEDILRLMDEQATGKINFLAVGQGRMTRTSDFRHLQVIYKDYVAGESNMADCLRASDLFIYPTRADNLPNSLVESIACGVPAVTFDVGGNKEIITGDYNGVMLPPFDLNAFAKQALDLLANNEKRALFSKNCRERACRLFTDQEMAARYYQLYQNIVSRRSPNI